ncbi:MAG: hypothetical protein HQL91_08835 [Magnetococcales bacterium]|nr:hypothetical protein [Magnetococcales bacterium]
MNRLGHIVRPLAPGQPVRERNTLSLERLVTRRPRHDNLLLFAPPAALSYLQELVTFLRLEEKITCQPLPPQESLLTRSLALIRERGPFMRLHVVWEWSGKAPETTRLAWEHYQSMLFEQASIQPRLIVCRPLFELWILLHEEDPGPWCGDVAQIQTRMASLRHLAPEASLLTLTAPRLGVALKRSQEMARTRHFETDDDLLPLQPGTHLHELILFWHKLARRDLPEARTVV